MVGKRRQSDVPWMRPIALAAELATVAAEVGGAGYGTPDKDHGGLHNDPYPPEPHKNIWENG